MSRLYHIEQDLGATSPVLFTCYQVKDGPRTDLTGCTARLELDSRDSRLDATLTSENGGITLGGIEGTITVGLDHADYADLIKGAYTWRLAVTYSNGETRYLFRGNWTIR